LETQYEENNIGNKNVYWRIILKWDFENRLLISKENLIVSCDHVIDVFHSLTYCNKGVFLSLMKELALHLSCS
jgi:hypothetical protein